MTRRALVIGCGGTIGGAWIVAALAALTRELDVKPADFDILQGTSAGAELDCLQCGNKFMADDVPFGSGSRYRLRRLLKVGGMAYVFSARHRNGRRVGPSLRGAPQFDVRQQQPGRPRGVARP